MEDIPEEEFLQGQTTRSVYNSDKNVRIGDMINHIYNDEIGVLIKDADEGTLGRVNLLSEGLTSEELISEFAFDDNVIVYNLKEDAIFYEKVSKQLKVTNDTTWETNFSIFQAEYGSCDNSQKTYKLHGIGLRAAGIFDFDIYQGHDKRLEIFVDWGDGQTNYYTAYVSIAANTLTWPILPGNHTYANVGTYNITIKVKRPYHTTWVAEKTNTITVNYLCGLFHSGLETSKFYKYSSDQVKAMSGQIFTHQNFWGRPVFEAETRAFERKNGRYKSKKAERIVAQLWFTSYTGCTGSTQNNAAARWPYNDKKTSAKCDGFLLYTAYFAVLNSNHRLYYNGSFLNLDLQLIRCQ